MAIRTGPRRISDFQLAGEHRAGEGVSALSAQNLSALILLSKKMRYHFVVCSTANYYDTYLQAASGKTYLAVPGKLLNSNILV